MYPSESQSFGYLLGSSGLRRSLYLCQVSLSLTGNSTNIGILYHAYLPVFDLRAIAPVSVMNSRYLSLSFKSRCLNLGIGPISTCKRLPYNDWQPKRGYGLKPLTVVIFASEVPPRPISQSMTVTCSGGSPC